MSVVKLEFIFNSCIYIYIYIYLLIFTTKLNNINEKLILVITLKALLHIKIINKVKQLENIL